MTDYGNAEKRKDAETIGLNSEREREVSNYKRTDGNDLQLF